MRVPSPPPPPPYVFYCFLTAQSKAGKGSNITEEAHKFSFHLPSFSPASLFISSRRNDEFLVEEEESEEKEARGPDTIHRVDWHFLTKFFVVAHLKEEREGIGRDREETVRRVGWASSGSRFEKFL